MVAAEDIKLAIASLLKQKEVDGGLTAAEVAQRVHPGHGAEIQDMVTLVLESLQTEGKLTRKNGLWYACQTNSSLHVFGKS